MEVIKELVTRTVRGMQLCDVTTGIVERVSPLRIRVGSKLILEQASLLLCDTAVGKRADLSHRHGETGREEPDLSDVALIPDLAVGDTTVLLRAAGGKRYYVIARVAGEGRA